MRIKFAELVRKQNLVNSLITKEELDLYDSKIKLAIQIWNERFEIIRAALFEKANKKGQRKVAIININTAETKDLGKLKVLARTGESYNYTAAGEKKRMELIRKVNARSTQKINDMEVEFKPFLLKDEATIETLDRFALSQLVDIFIPAHMMPQMPLDIDPEDLVFHYDDTVYSGDEEDEDDGEDDLGEVKKEEKYLVKE